MKRLMMVLAVLALLSVSLGALADWTPGTYTSSAQGMNGPVNMIVTVDAESILSVDAGEHQESPGVSDPAFEKIPAEIVEYQTVALDVVSGCTVSSNSILAAVKNALISALAFEEKITKVPQKQVVDIPSLSSMRRMWSSSVLGRRHDGGI